LKDANLAKGAYVDVLNILQVLVKSITIGHDWALHRQQTSLSAGGDSTQTVDVTQCWQRQYRVIADITRQYTDSRHHSVLVVRTITALWHFYCPKNEPNQVDAKAGNPAV